MTSPETDPKLNQELTEVVRRWGRETTPAELEARGIRRVHSVSLRTVAALLEKAVNRTLIRRTLDGAPDDALTLSSSAREEFLRLARGERGADTARIANRATSTLDRLKRELAERRAALAVEEAAPRTWVEDREERAFEERLRALFAQHGGTREIPAALEREVLAATQEVLEQVRGRERAARRREHRREIGTLERRIAKLTALLGESEAELRRARAAREVDPGLASIYDEVQGLAGDDPEVERKGELMLAIFRANQDLRRPTGS